MNWKNEEWWKTPFDGKPWGQFLWQRLSVFSVYVGSWGAIALALELFTAGAGPVWFIMYLHIPVLGAAFSLNFAFSALMALVRFVFRPRAASAVSGPRDMKAQLADLNRANRIKRVFKSTRHRAR